MSLRVSQETILSREMASRPTLSCEGIRSESVSIRLYLAINFNFLLCPTLDLVDHLRGFSRILDLRSLSLFPGLPDHTAIRGGVQLMSCLAGFHLGACPDFEHLLWFALSIGEAR